MEFKDVKLTNQMARVFEIAEQECLRVQSPCLLPEHLLLGCLDDGSYPIKEAKQKSGIDINVMKNSLDLNAEKSHYENCSLFKIPICQSTRLVIEQAINYMTSYNQNYLNEGHVLKALIKTGITEKLFTEEQKNTLLGTATVSRDMSLDLTGFNKKTEHYRKIRVVRNEDAERLMLFINEEFGARWTESIKHGLRQSHPSIFIAEDQKGSIVGFAAFDIHKPRYFGPMGVAKNKRAEGIGKSLLHICLEGMQKKGYKDIIIDNAGPIEFYEKVCNAKVVPFDK